MYTLLLSQGAKGLLRMPSLSQAILRKEVGRMKLTIPATPPSLNVQHRMHYRAKMSLKREWVLQIRAVLPIPFNSRLNRKKKVVITLFHSRPYDKDNAYGAVKPVVDAMKVWCLLRDDTAEWLDLSVEQEKWPHKRRHTVIEIEEVWPDG